MRSHSARVAPRRAARRRRHRASPAARGARRPRRRGGDRTPEQRAGRGASGRASARPASTADRCGRSHATRTLARSMAGRVALVHDFLLDLRGAERVFAAICDAWPEADVFTAVYDERGTEGRFAERAPAHLVPAAHAPDGAHVPAAAAALPARDRVVRPARLRHCDLVVERLGARRARRSRRRARLLLPQPVPLRVERAGGDAGGAPSARAPGAARAAQPLAPVGLDRGPARRPLRRQLAPHGDARAALLRARVDRAAPAGRDRALPARRPSASTTWSSRS